MTVAVGTIAGHLEYEGTTYEQEMETAGIIYKSKMYCAPD